MNAFTPGATPSNPFLNNPAVQLPAKFSMKLLIAGLALLLILLQAALWGRQGLLDLWDLRDLNLSGRIESNKLIERNRVLEQEISDMKSGLGAIEKEAREELGMVKQGETFFRVIEQPAAGDAPPAAGD